MLETSQFAKLPPPAKFSRYTVILNMASGNHDKLTSNNEVKLYFWCTELKSNQLWWPVNSLFNRSPFAVLYEWNESKVAADLGTGWTKTGCTEAALSHSDPEVFTVYFIG